MYYIGLRIHFLKPGVTNHTGRVMDLSYRLQGSDFSSTGLFLLEWPMPCRSHSSDQQKCEMVAMTHAGYPPKHRFGTIKAPDGDKEQTR